MENKQIFIDKQGIQNDIQMHLSDYLFIILKYKWIVVGSFLFIVACTTIGSLISTPTYRATAQIMIREKPTALEPLGNNSTRGFAKNEYFQTQVNLLSNEKLAWAVIDSLNLKDVREQKSKEKSVFSTLKQMVSFAGVLFAEKNNPDNPAAEEQSSADMDPELIGWYLKRFTTTPLRDSNLVDVYFEGENPGLITRIINKHLELAIEHNMQFQREHANRTLTWLKGQIAKQKDSVEEAQQKIHTYKKKNDLLTVRDRRNILSVELDELNLDLIEARNVRIAKQAAYDQMQRVEVRSENLMVMPEIVNDSVLESLRNRLVELKARKIELATKYGSRHPKMLQLDLSIKEMENEINSEILRLKKAVKAELDRAKSVEQDLLAVLKSKKKAAIELDEKIIEYDVLSRQSSSSNDLYDFLLKQSQEINLSSVMDASSIQIVNKAQIPQKPIKPKHMINIMLGIVLGGLFSSGLAFFLEYMDNTVKESLDVTSKVGLPVLGMIPYQKENKKKTIPALPWKEDPSPNQVVVSTKPPVYRNSDRFPILFEANENGLPGRVVTIESATMQEGKTTTAIKSAETLSKSGMQVLLVDGDFLRPNLSKAFGAHNGRGLIPYFRKISDFKIDAGDLSTCSIGDLFFLIGMKRKNGQLTVKNNEEQTMEIFFKNGKMAHLHYKNNPDINRLGRILVNSGLISPDLLTDALRRNKRTGQPIGYLLLNSGYLTRDKLQGPLRLQMEENLQKLFSWKHGNFRFKSAQLNFYDDERIFFHEEYTGFINMLAKTEGSKYIENTLFAQIKGGYKENLYVLASGSGGVDFQINQQLMKKTIEILKQRFEAIVIDTSPIEAQAGTSNLAAFADDIIFVIKSGKLSSKVINQAKSSLPQEKILGAILNQVKETGSSYYNYY